LERSVAPREVVGALEQAGWESSYRGEIFHMLEGDDEFEWRTASSSDHSLVLDKLETAVRAGQHVAIAMRWQAGPGGDFLLSDSTGLSFTGSIDRPTLAGVTPFTDASWYVSRVLPPLLAFGVVQVQTCDRP